MEETLVETFTPDRRLKLYNSLKKFHGKFLDASDFKPHRCISVDTEYLFVANEDESLVLLIPTLIILGRQEKS